MLAPYCICSHSHLPAGTEAPVPSLRWAQGPEAPRPGCCSVPHAHGPVFLGRWKMEFRIRLTHRSYAGTAEWGSRDTVGFWVPFRARADVETKVGDEGGSLPRTGEETGLQWEQRGKRHTTQTPVIRVTSLCLDLLMPPLKLDISPCHPQDILIS